MLYHKILLRELGKNKQFLGTSKTKVVLILSLPKMPYLVWVPFGQCGFAMKVYDQ
jgi:TM2 domain-containing membrane protein YozV